MRSGCTSYRQVHRRDFFRIGGAGLFGLTLADFFQRQCPRRGACSRRPSRPSSCS